MVLLRPLELLDAPIPDGERRGVDDLTFKGGSIGGILLERKRLIALHKIFLVGACTR